MSWLEGMDNRTTHRKTEETRQMWEARESEKQKGQLLSHVQLFATPWTRVFCPSNFPGKNTESVSIPSPGDLPTQGLNLHLLHRRQVLYYLSHQGNPGRSRLVGVVGWGGVTK